MSALIVAAQGAERWQPQIQRQILPRWQNGLAFVLLPGVGFGLPLAAVTPPSAVGVYSDLRFGQAYKSGASATKSWNTACGSLGTEYTLLVLASYVASQPLIADDSPTSNLSLQCGGAAGKFVLTAYNTSGTAYSATSAAVSSAEQLTGTIIGARVSGSQNAVRLTIDGVTVSTTTTGTLRAPSNPRIGGLKAGTAPNAVIALAAAWSYYMPDSQLAELLANPYSIVRTGRRFYFSAAGGNVYNLSVAESGAASDAPSALAAFAASMAEGGAASDLPSALASFAASTAEAGAASDVPGATASFAAAVTEAGAAVDAPSATAVFAASVVEAGSASDSEATGGATYGVTLSESGLALDSVSATVAFVGAVNESGSAADAPAATASFAAAIAESGSATDAPGGSASFFVSVAEMGSALDGPNYGGQIYGVTLAEAGFAQDAVSAVVTFAASIAESGAALDQFAATAVVSALIAESGDALDAPSATANMSVQIVEAGAAIDLPNGAFPYTLTTDPRYVVAPLGRSFVITALHRRFLVATLNRKFDA